MSYRYLSTLILFALALPAAADEVRYYTENGVTYRETRRLVQRPVTETRTQQSTRTVYREQWTTEQREYLRVSYVPVTEYRYEQYWAGRYNPFGQPYLAARYVPHTRWEQRSERVTLPVHIRKVTPEAQTVSTPVTASRMVTEELVDRVPITPLPTATQLAGPPTLTAPSTMTGVPTPQIATPAPAYAANRENAVPANAAAADGAPSVPATLPTSSPRFTAPAPASTYSPAQPQVVPLIAPPGGFAPAAQPTAQRPLAIGGVSRLDQDPPRYGWRAAQ